MAKSQKNSAESTRIVANLKQLGRPTTELRLLDGNPRKGDVEAVKRSLVAFGQRKPIVANKDGQIIAGNHTYQAAIELGWTEIAVVYVDDDPATARAFALADNRTSDLGSYDDRALMDLITQIEKDNPALLDAASYDGQTINDLLTGLGNGNQLLGDVDQLPEQIPSINKLGDLWLLGRHRLLCGSSLESESYDKLLGPESINMVWTDPPYGVNIQERDLSQAIVRGRRKDGKGILNDDLEGRHLEEFLRQAFTLAYKVSEPGSAFYVAAPGGPIHQLFGNVLNELKVWRHTLIWTKDRFVMGRADYHYRHEPIFYGWKEGASHKWNGGRNKDTVLEFKRPGRSELHPTMKPVELVAFCIENSSNVNDRILDPFGGSGTTLIAAEQTNRQANLIELDTSYCDAICARYQQLTGIKPVNVETGKAVDFQS